VFGFVPFHTRVGLTLAFEQRILQFGFPRLLASLRKQLRFLGVAVVWFCISTGTKLKPNASHKWIQ
jgi:hypothetical protein